MIVTSVQIKTVKMQKHLYCPVFTRNHRNFGRITVVSLLIVDWLRYAIMTLQIEIL